MKIYKEMIRFIGTCLSLNQKPDNKEKIRATLCSEQFSFEYLVEVASGQYILLSVYWQLKKADLLSCLPDDLVEYLTSLYEQNALRNQQIIAEAKEITQLFNQHGLEPVFLKGTGHLLRGLYEGVGERFVGDIDLLVLEKESDSAFQLLIESGYLQDLDNHWIKLSKQRMKHHLRITKKDKLAAVEVHWDVVYKKYQALFPGSNLVKQSVLINCESEHKARVLDGKHAIVYNMLNAQVNDYGHQARIVQLRNLYDFLLLSDRVKCLDHCGVPSLFSEQWSAYRMLASEVFDLAHLKSLEFVKQSGKHCERVWYLQDHFRSAKIHSHFIVFRKRFDSYWQTIVAAFEDRGSRKYLFYRLSSPSWYVHHFKGYFDF